MAQTLLQVANEAMAQAQSISAEKAIAELGTTSNALLVDVRDESEVAVTGVAYDEGGMTALLAAGLKTVDGLYGCS